MNVLIFWLCIFSIAIAGGNTHAQNSFAVVELFTSEGCSSCPPAEKLLAELQAEAKANRKDIYFLQYHVDYWNRLGWKDPYSSFQFTNRQKNYTSVLNEESMYTPMMIVNGRKAFTGSDRQAAKSAIAEALQKISPHPALTARLDSLTNDTAYIHYEFPDSNPNLYVRAALTQDDLSTEVAKGENAGKTLVHQAVVRSLASTTSQKSGQVKVPLKKVPMTPQCRLIVFVQHKQTMDIFSAAVVGVLR